MGNEDSRHSSLTLLTHRGKQALGDSFSITLSGVPYTYKAGHGRAKSRMNGSMLKI